MSVEELSRFYASDLSNRELHDSVMAHRTIESGQITLTEFTIAVDELFRRRHFLKEFAKS